MFSNNIKKINNIKLALKVGAIFSLIFIPFVAYTFLSVKKEKLKNKNISFLNYQLDVVRNRQKDHLIWVQELGSTIIYDFNDKLKIEKNFEKCDFGKWYYSDERKKLEKHIPELKEEFSKIYEPHKLMHISAELIESYLLENDPDNDIKTIYQEEIVKNMVIINSSLNTVCDIIREKITQLSTE